MVSPDVAVDELVERVQKLAGAARDPHAVRTAFAEVLSNLGVEPGDPAWTDGRDIVGAAYERLLRGRDRRPLGQFFTPLPIGRAMASWLLASRPRLLLDPACGSGSLLIAAAHEPREETRLAGIDVDTLAIAMAQANAALRAISDLGLNAGNFLHDEVAEAPEAILCNPPFTRHQALDPAEKQAIHDGFKDRLGLELSQLASLHALFLVRALEVSACDARLAFITPANWLDTNYGRAVKEFVLERAHVEAIVLFPARQLVFERAATTAAITLIRKQEERGTGAATLVARAASTSQEDIARAMTDRASGREVQLSTAERWSRTGPAPRLRRRSVTRLGDVAKVRRGAATGCNEFFVLSDEDRRFHGLNRCYLRPCAASPRWFDGDEITEVTLASLPDEAPRWLFYPSRERLGGPLEFYLRRADGLGVHQASLVKQRVQAGRPWWQVESDFEAPILFTYLNRSRPRFIRNRVGAVPLNNWLVIQPAEDVGADALFAALKNATEKMLRSGAREYGSGLWKLEPSELKRLALHDF